MTLSYIEMKRLVLKELPYSIEVSLGVLESQYINESKPYIWCKERLGLEMLRETSNYEKEERSWDLDLSRDWDFYNEVFFFRNEEDALLFKLTFGGK